MAGANGMLGQALVRALAVDHEVWAACRQPDLLPHFVTAHLGDVRDPGEAARLIDSTQPEVVINAVGIVKSRSESPSTVIAVNSVWPNALSETGARLIHVSTDCVFSGNRGNYDETAMPDAADLYGRSKLLGEIEDRENVLTIRTSFVGWQGGLLAWFAAGRHEPVPGYTRAVFSGFSVRTLAETIRDQILPNPALSGLYHVSAQPITKYRLLSDLASALGWRTRIDAVSEPAIDRSLDSTRWRDRMGWRPPSWDRMVADLAQEWAA